MCVCEWSSVSSVPESFQSTLAKFRAMARPEYMPDAESQFASLEAEAAERALDFFSTFAGVVWP